VPLNFFTFKIADFTRRIIRGVERDLSKELRLSSRWHWKRFMFRLYELVTLATTRNYYLFKREKKVKE
jgi:hypothetical protein